MRLFTKWPKWCWRSLGLINRWPLSDLMRNLLLKSAIGHPPTAIPPGSARIRAHKSLFFPKISIFVKIGQRFGSPGRCIFFFFINRCKSRSYEWDQLFYERSAGTIKGRASKNENGGTKRRFKGYCRSEGEGRFEGECRVRCGKRGPGTAGSKNTTAGRRLLRTGPCSSILSAI